MQQSMGYDTGVNLDALLACARESPQLVGHDVQLLKAGRRDTLHPVPADFEGARARAHAREIA